MLLKNGFPNAVRKAKRAAARRGRRLRILFADEARFGRINRPRPCWAPIGIRPEVASQLIREYIYLYGAASPKDGTCVYLIMPDRIRRASRPSSTPCHESLPSRISSWFSTAPPTIAAATSCFQAISRCSSCHPTRRSSTQRKISGMKSAKKSSRTTPSNQSTLCAPNSSRRSSTSNAIPQWSNPSRLSLISPSHSDVELVLQHFQRPTSSHFCKDAPSLSRVGYEHVARGSRGRLKMFEAQNSRVLLSTT